MLIFSVDITSNIKTQKKLKKSLNKERFISFLDIKVNVHNPITFL